MTVGRGLRMSGETRLVKERGPSPLKPRKASLADGSVERAV